MYKTLRIIAASGLVSEPMPQADEALRQHARLQGQLLDVLGRALCIRHVDAGSCNACELEIHALNNPIYNLEGAGIRFVASPRHADMLLVTGPVTRNMEVALRRTWEATPGPKLVVGVGGCAAGCGVFGKGPEIVGPVAAVIPVDVLVPGCPPSPLAILQGIVTAVSTRHASA
jgi:Ni,Fe-hydrogenase III small subunit